MQKPENRRLDVIDAVRSVVVKVGTRVLTTPAGKLDLHRIDCLSAQLCRIAESQRQTIIVSSGAVGIATVDLTGSRTEAPNVPGLYTSVDTDWGGAV